MSPQSLARFCACDPEPIPLPPLKKKILYLDQNAVSNLAHHRESTGKRPDEAGQTLEKRLGRAVRRQLAVCPVSLSHQFESAVSPHFEAFMTTAECLAAGCSFVDFETIRASQLTTAFVAHIERTQVDLFRLPAEPVMNQNPHLTLDPPPRVLSPPYPLRVLLLASSPAK